MRAPFFPFYVEDWYAAKLAKDDADFIRAVDRERMSNITSLEVSGSLGADRVLKLYAHCSTDNGFCMASGRIWNREVELDTKLFDRLVEKQLGERAIQELDAEEARKRQLLIDAKAAEIRAELLP